MIAFCWFYQVNLSEFISIFQKSILAFFFFFFFFFYVIIYLYFLKVSTCFISIKDFFIFTEFF